MLRHRLLLLLVVALSLCTLAAADSVPVSLSLPHSTTGIHYHFSPSDSSLATAASGNFGSHASPDTIRTPLVTNSLTRVAMPIGSLSNRHRAPDFTLRNSGGGHGTAPEPGSLALLSTGLFGIAGLVRRKLLRS